METEIRLEVPVYAHEGLLEAFTGVVLAGVAQNEFSAQMKVFTDSEDEVWKLIEDATLVEGKIVPEALDPELCKELVLRSLRSKLFSDTAGDVYKAKYSMQKETNTALMRVSELKVIVKTIDPQRPAIQRVDSQYFDRANEVSVISECTGKILDVGEYRVGDGHFLIQPRLRDLLHNFPFKNFWYRVCPVDLKTGEPLVEISSSEVWNTRYEYSEKLASLPVVTTK